MTKTTDRRYEILLVEDSLADADQIRTRLRGTESHDQPCNVCWVVSSINVITFLRTAEMASYVPDLFIVDYKKPSNEGRVIVELKSDPEYLHIPLIALASSLSQDHLCDIYRRGANCCYRKPGKPKEFDRLAEWIRNHWLTEVCIPGCATGE